MNKIYFLAISFIVIASPLFAQYSNMTDTIFNLDEVTVTAKKKHIQEMTKLNVPLKFIPITVNTVPTELLAERGIINLQDAVKFLPGTRMRTTYGAYQQFQVRGFDYTPIMIDGVRDERTSINNSAPFPDLASVETIELLKGPASVLYGHSAVGGIMNVVRKAPVNYNLVSARLSYGLWNNKQAMMDFGGNIYKTLNYRAAINWSDNEGYRHTNDKRLSGYLALAAQLNEKQTLDIRGGFNRDKYGTEIGLPRFMTDDIYKADDDKLYLLKGEMLPGLNKRWRYNNESDFMINNGANALIKYSNNISEVFKIENRLAYNYDDIDYFSTEQLIYPESSEPIYSYYYKSGDTKKYINLDSVQLNSPLRFAYTVNVINNELEVSGKLHLGSVIYNYTAGYTFVVMFRDRYRGYNLGEDVVGPGLYSKVPVYNPHSMGYMETSFSSAIVNRTFTHSAYLQNLFEFSDKFKAMVSGRFDYFDFWNANADTKDGKRKYTDRGDFQKVNNNAFTYRVGVVYLPLPSLSVYASVANFFSPFRDFYNPTTVYINKDGHRFYPKDGEEIFKPQKGYQGEIGMRYEKENLFQLTASAYYIHRNNEKKTLGSLEEDGVTKSIIGQVGTTDSKGFEVDFHINPIQGLALSLGYAFTDARIQDLKKNDYMQEDPQKGMRLAGIPKNTFFTAGGYAIQKGCLENLRVHYTVSYTDNVYRTVDRDVIYSAYWQTDLGASYALNNGLNFGVNVNNVFDKYYFNQSLGRQITPGLPRNYQLSIGYRLN